MRRLVIWKSKEDCLKYHKRHPYEDRPEWYIKELVNRSMIYGDYPNFKDDEQVERFKGLYDVRVI